MSEVEWCDLTEDLDGKASYLPSKVMELELDKMLIKTHGVLLVEFVFMTLRYIHYPLAYLADGTIYIWKTRPPLITALPPWVS